MTEQPSALATQRATAAARVAAPYVLEQELRVPLHDPLWIALAHSDCVDVLKRIGKRSRRVVRCRIVERRTDAVVWQREPFGTAEEESE